MGKLRIVLILLLCLCIIIIAFLFRGGRGSGSGEKGHGEPTVTSSENPDESQVEPLSSQFTLTVTSRGVYHVEIVVNDNPLQTIKEETIETYWSSFRDELEKIQKEQVNKTPKVILDSFQDGGYKDRTKQELNVIFGKEIRIDDRN